MNNENIELDCEKHIYNMYAMKVQAWTTDERNGLWYVIADWNCGGILSQSIQEKNSAH